MKCTVVAVFHPRANGGYECRVPDFPGCITSGRDLQEAALMIEDAANFWACGIERDGRPQPTITPYQDIKHRDSDILKVITVDTDAYRRQHIS